MARGVLANIETYERETEAVYAANEVEKPSVRDDSVACLMKRPVNEQQGREELSCLGQGLLSSSGLHLPPRCARIAVRVAGRFGTTNDSVRPAAPAIFGAEASFDRSNRRGEPVANRAEEHPVRLVRLPAERIIELVRPRGHRKLRSQRFDFFHVESRADPSREKACLAGDVRSDIRIAITVASDPGAETYRQRVDRQRLAGMFVQRRIERPDVLRQRIPERLLEDEQAPLHLVERLGPLVAHLVRLPCRRDLPA